MSSLFMYTSNNKTEQIYIVYPVTVVTMTTNRLLDVALFIPFLKQYPMKNGKLRNGNEIH